MIVIVIVTGTVLMIVIAVNIEREIGKSIKRLPAKHIDKPRQVSRINEIAIVDS